MTRRTSAWLLFGLALAISPAAGRAAPADENKDLDRIPAPTAPTEPNVPATPTGGTQRIFAENAFSLAGDRGDLVPPPGAGPEPWTERLFLDARKSWRLNPDVTLNFSGLLNFRGQRDIPFPNRENFRLDFREGYLSWTAGEGAFVDVGRINLKGGVAFGANPTDFFKTRATVDALTADPSALREDRLGTLMVEGQKVWTGGALTIAFAPRFYRPTPIYSSLNLPTLNPMFDRTNAQDRTLVKVTANLTKDFSPEFLVYNEAGRTRFGANLTGSVGQSAIVYAEWAGGVRASLIDDALRYGRQTGTIPAAAPSALPESSGRHFMNDLSAGLNYTTASKINVIVEYDYHQAGLTTADWNNWIAIGHAFAAVPPIPAQLWYIRAYASDQSEQFKQHAAFIRVDRMDAFVRQLELSGLVSVDLSDGSGLTQVGADYFLSDTYTIGALALATFGSRRTEFGSLPQSSGILFKLARYF